MVTTAKRRVAWSPGPPEMGSSRWDAEETPRLHIVPPARPCCVLQDRCGFVSLSVILTNCETGRP